MPIKRIVNRKFLHKTNTGVASILGQSALLIKDFIFQSFPEGYLKDYYINSQLSNIQLAPRNIHKRKKPFVTLKPRYSLEPSSLFGALYPYHDAYDHTRSSMKLHFPLFSDQINHFYIYCINDRINLSYDIEFICNTMMEQINLAYNLKGTIPHKRPFEIWDQPLEIEIPKFYIKYLAILNGFINEQNEFDEEKFQVYLDENSQSPITKKRKPSSGRYEYFFQFRTNFYLNLDDLPNIDEPNKENMSEMDARITDNIAVSFWSPMHFYFEHRNPQHLLMHDIMLEVEQDKATESTLEFNPNKVFVEINTPLLAPNEMYYGMKLIYDFGWETEKLASNNIEMISIRDIAEYTCIQIIDYIKKYRLDANEYFKAAIFNMEEQIPDEDISIDWANLRIIFKNAKSYERYHVCIYARTERVIKSLRSIEKINKYTAMIEDDTELYKLFVDLESFV